MACRTSGFPWILWSICCLFHSYCGLPLRRRLELSSTYADDCVGHKMAAANKYRRPKTPLERRSVGEADRVGDGMVVGVNLMQRVEGGHVELC
jgi:hypothetical protein